MLTTFRRIRELPLADQPFYRLTHSGPTGLSTTELLALLLGLSSLEEAQAILCEHTNLQELARAAPADLEQLPGIGPAQRARLEAAFEIARRLQIPAGDIRARINSPSDAAQLLLYEMSRLEQEHLRVILLDTRNQVKRIDTIYIGSLNAAVVRVAELFRPAIRHSAAAIILVHNHPSGDPSPSSEDVRMTREVVKAGKLLDIELLDHLIIGGGRFVSLKERALGFNEND
jgi:DNA repair protein RadC